MKALVVLIVACLVGVKSSQASAAEWKTMSPLEQVDVVVSELERCPSWIRFEPEETEIRSGIVTLLGRLNCLSTEVLKKGIEKYWHRRCDFRNPDVRMEDLLVSQAKVFLAVRVFFDVPRHATFDPSMSIGPFVSPSDQGVDLLWPLECQVTGQLQLVGSGIVGMSGPSYDGIKDFAYMEAHFQRRSVARTTSE